MKLRSSVQVVALAVVMSMLSGRTQGQTFTVLHTFSPVSGSPILTNTDGANPYAGLIQAADGNLYGTTYNGGAAGWGTIFQMMTNGGSFTVLYPFPSTNGAANPRSELLQTSDGNFYGTTESANVATPGYGTIYKVTTNGAFTVLHEFNISNGLDGVNPWAPLIESNGILYGTTWMCGLPGYPSPGARGGAVFSIGIDSTNLTILYNFSSDLTRSAAELILSGDTLYGTALDYGTRGGVVFAINTDGTDYTNLFNFSGGANGSYPEAGLALSGRTLYGTTIAGTASGGGTLFSVGIDGTGFRILHSFFTTNADISGPHPKLILQGNTLYGTTYSAGHFGSGTVFTIHTDGTSFINIYTFTGGADGANPSGNLLLLGNTLYGTTRNGGSSGNGTVFSLSLPPELAITPIGENAILTWQTNFTGFSLQSTTNLGPSAVWATNLPSPAVVNGLNTVTNPISGTQQFFRLSQ